MTRPQNVPIIVLLDHAVQIGPGAASERIGQRLGLVDVHECVCNDRKLAVRSGDIEVVYEIA